MKFCRFNLNRRIEKLEKQITKLKEEIAANKEKVDYYDAVANAEGTISIQQLSVLLTQSGFKIGEKSLFNLMREDGFLCKKPWNCPSKKALEQSLMSYYEKLYLSQDKKAYVVSYMPRLTNRGKQFFLNYYLRKAELFSRDYDAFDDFDDDDQI